MVSVYDAASGYILPWTPAALLCRTTSPFAMVDGRCCRFAAHLTRLVDLPKQPPAPFAATPFATSSAASFTSAPSAPFAASTEPPASQVRALHAFASCFAVHVMLSLGSRTALRRQHSAAEIIWLCGAPTSPPPPSPPPPSPPPPRYTCRLHLQQLSICLLSCSAGMELLFYLQTCCAPSSPMQLF